MFNGHLKKLTGYFLVLATLGAPGCAFAQNLQRQTLLSRSFVVHDGKVRVAFFDADSTLRVSQSGSVSANSPTDVLLLPGVATKLAQLTQEGYLIAIVSNQGGIKSGLVTREVADAALLFTAEEIHKNNPSAQINYYDFSEGDGVDRKPGRGMADRLDKNLAELGWTIDWKKSFMVGDSAYKKGVDVDPSGTPGTNFSNADRLFAENLNIPFYEPRDFFGWREYGINVFETVAQVTDFQKRFESVYSCQLIFR